MKPAPPTIRNVSSAPFTASSSRIPRRPGNRLPFAGNPYDHTRSRLNVGMIRPGRYLAHHDLTRLFTECSTAAVLAGSEQLPAHFAGRQIARRSGPFLDGFPPGRGLHEGRVRDQQMPENGAEAFGVGGDAVIKEGRDDDTGVRCHGCEPAVPTHDAEHFGPQPSGQLDRTDEIHRDVSLQIPTADREDQKAVRLVQPRAAQPVGKAGVPALVIDPSRQLRNIVTWRVGLEATDLAEVIDGMAGVTRRTADPQDEEASPPIADPGQFPCQPLDHAGIDSVQDDMGLFEVQLAVTGHRRYPADSLSRLNMSTVSLLNSSRSLPSRFSFERMASVTVMMSTPISSAWTTLSNSRGLAQSSSICSSMARQIDRAAFMCGTGSRPASAIRPAKTDTIEGSPRRRAWHASHTCSSVKTAVTFTLTPRRERSPITSLSGTPSDVVIGTLT